MTYKTYKRTLILLLVATIAAGSLYWIFSRNTLEAEAAWWNESWLYRKAIPVTKNTAPESNVYIEVTIDTSDATKFQPDCGDLRFTGYAGDVLPYYIVSGCGTASTVVHVNVEDLPVGAQTIYYYYGNFSADNGFASADFADVATDYAIGTIGAEERGPGPVAYWKFDEGFGQTANDSALSNNDGMLGATSGSELSDPTWQTEDMCISGKCLKFDGGDYVNTGNGASLDITSAITVEAWVKGSSQIGNTIVSKHDYVPNKRSWRMQSSDISSTKFNAAVSQDGGSTNRKNYDSSIDVFDNIWHHIAFTFDGSSLALYVDGVYDTNPTIIDDVAISSIYSSTLDTLIGAQLEDGSPAYFFSGFIDDVKIYPYARTTAQIKKDYVSRGSSQGASVAIGGDSKQSLSNGLVGYWKMDEASWNGTAGEVLDASGAGNNGIADGATGKPTTGGGKFGNGGVFDGFDDYVDAGNANILNPGTGDFSYSLWIKTTQNPAGNSWPVIINKQDANEPRSGWEIYLTPDSNGGIGGQVWIDGIGYSVGSDLIDDGIWHHIAVTLDPERLSFYKDGIIENYITPPASWNIAPTDKFIIGRQSTSLNHPFDGSIDEVRIYNRALSAKEVRDLYDFAPGPVGWWKMDEKVSGNAKTLNDSSGNANIGTTYYGANATGMNCMVPGKIGGGCQFDGVDDYVDAGNGADLSPIYGLSWGFWYKNGNIGSDQPIIFNQWSSGNAEGFIIDIDSGYGTDSRIRFELGNGIKWAKVYTDSNSSDNFEYYAGTYDGNTLKIYRNGVQQNSTDSLISPIEYYPSSNFMIGSNDSVNWFMNGSLDDVRIYNYARTQKQIVEDMLGSPKLVSSGGGNGGQGAVGYWKFNEGYGITANNSGFGGSTFNGTLTTMASPATATSGWTNSGKFGKALNFDGSNDYVSISDLDIGTVHSSSIWIDFQDSGDGVIVGGLSSGYLFYIDQTDLYYNTGGANYVSAGHEGLASGTWYNLSVVRNGTSVTFYKNGIHLGATQTLATNTAISNITAIGSYGNGTFPTTMRLDEVKIYNYALTENEIKLDYNQGASMKLGSTGTNSSGAPDNSASRAYCVPGDTATCDPPVGEWKMDEKISGDAKTLNDSSGNANIGTTYYGANATGMNCMVPGKIGGGCQFDGVDDHISISDHQSLDLTQTFTITLWAKRGASSIWRALVTKGVSSSDELDNYYVAFTDTNTLRFSIGDGSNTKGVTTSNTYDTDWHYFSFVFNGTADMRIYSDGVNQTTTPDGTATTPLANANPLRIGTSSSEYFNGYIDDVRIYDYARTPAQVAWDYNRGKPVAQWKFDECQGATANDASGNGNNGTITIGATVPQSTLGTCTDGLSTSAWYNGRVGKNNSAMSFDGVDDYVDEPTSVSNVGSVSFWVYPATSTQSFLQLTASANITSSSGTVSATGFVTPTIYVNGVSGGAITASAWNHITVTTATGITPNAIKIGRVGSTYFSGLIDDVKVFNYALTAEQVKMEYNGGAVNFK